MIRSKYTFEMFGMFLIKKLVQKSIKIVYFKSRSKVLQTSTKFVMHTLLSETFQVKRIGSTILVKIKESLHTAESITNGTLDSV